MTAHARRTAAVLRDLERRLDPPQPERTPGRRGRGLRRGVRVPAPRRAARASCASGCPGSPTTGARARYQDLVADLPRRARRRGHPRRRHARSSLVPRPGRPPVVVPRAAGAARRRRSGTGSSSTADDARAVVDVVERVLAAHVRASPSPTRERADGLEVAVDGQLSNWSFGADADGLDEPVLVDVGTPVHAARRPAPRRHRVARDAHPAGRAHLLPPARLWWAPTSTTTTTPVSSPSTCSATSTRRAGPTGCRSASTSSTDGWSATPTSSAGVQP